MTKEDTHTRGAVKDPEHDGRLKENRESGTSTGTSHTSAASHSSGSHSGGRGMVKDPEHDGRLKENRESRSSRGASHSASSRLDGERGHTPGAVRDPEHDGRLKENRGKGVHKS
jgi:hypothetical protein